MWLASIQGVSPCVRIQKSILRISTARVKIRIDRGVIAVSKGKPATKETRSDGRGKIRSPGTRISANSSREGFPVFEGRITCYACPAALDQDKWPPSTRRVFSVSPGRLSLFQLEVSLSCDCLVEHAVALAGAVFCAAPPLRAFIARYAAVLVAAKRGRVSIKK